MALHRMPFSSRNLRLTPARGAAALFLLTLLLYTNSLGGAFILDDEDQCTDFSGFVRHPIRDVLTKDVFSLLENGWSGVQYYRPLTVLLHRALILLTGARPLGMHLASVLLHALAGIACFLLLLEFWDSRIAWLGAALFVAHPLHVEAVSWMSALNEPLAGALMLWSLVALVKANPGTRPAWLWGRGAGPPGSSHSPADSTRPPRYAWLMAASCAAAAAAYLSKESAYMLPFLAAVFVGRRAWPLAATAAATLGLRFALLGSVAVQLPQRGLAGHLHVALASLAIYVNKTLWPWPLAFEYDLRVGLMTWLALAAACLAFAWLAWRYAPARACVLLFALPLAPALAGSLAFPAFRQTQDRYAYLAVLGLCVLLAPLATRRAGVMALTALLIAWCTVSSLIIPYWYTTETLWWHTLKVTPASKNAVLALGEWYFMTQEFEKAEAVYDEGLRHRPNDRDFLKSRDAVRQTLARRRVRTHP